MSFDIKKLVFYSFLTIFIIFSLSTCVETEEDVGETTYTNVEYSADGRSLTIYLDGSAPVKADRALSKQLAEVGHDFFEVTFLYNDAGTYRIARASWELGEPAGVSDVYRTETGVDYYIPANPLGLPATGLPASDGGLAVLFVGRKSDKSLLAVGALSHIDGESVATRTSITTSTTKVTFALNAFKAGVLNTYSASSFQITSPPGSVAQGVGGELETIKIGGVNYPYFLLPRSVTATATYTIGVHSSSHPYSFYAPAIKYAGGAQCWNIKPHYTLPPNIEKSDSDYLYSSGTTISITSPPAVGGSFSGTVNFSITTPAVASAICALTFRMPVYAVYKRPMPVSGETEPIEWFIKPGYDMYYQELDNGKVDNGGAVLIAIGDILGEVEAKLIIMGEPKKYNNLTPNGLNFTLEGIEIFFKDSGTLNLTPAGNANYPNYWGWGNLEFYYDANPKDSIDIADTLMVSGGPQPLPEGLVKIRVVYYPNGIGNTPFYDATFTVEVNNIISAVNIPYERRFFVTKKEDFLDVANNVRNGEYLLVFGESVNMPNMEFSINGNVTIYMVATVPNVIIGRDGGNARITFVSSTGLDDHSVYIYMGKWPFNEPAFAGGNVIIPYLFKVSSRGTFGNFGAAGGATTTMFGDSDLSHRCRPFTVNPLAGIEVNYPAYLGP